MNLLDFKDAKNLIIYLLGACIGLAIYAYQDDQQDIRDHNNSMEKAVQDKMSVMKSAMLNEFQDIKNLCSDLTDKYDNLRTGQEAIAIDVARLKALQEK